jgi:hypothetical protein
MYNDLAQELIAFALLLFGVWAVGAAFMVAGHRPTPPLLLPPAA